MGYSTEVNSNCDTYVSGQTSIFKTKYEKNKLPETRLFVRFLCQICATFFSFLTTSLWASASLSGSRLQMHQQPRTPNNRAQSSNVFPNCFSQILLYANIFKKLRCLGFSFVCFLDRNKIDFAFNKCTDKDDDIRPSHLPCFCGDCLHTQMAYSHEPSLHVSKDSDLSVHLKMNYRIQCKGDFTMPSLRLVQA